MPENAPLQVGQMAPDFELMNQDKNPVKLSAYRGKKKVMLLFYPMDFSPPSARRNTARSARRSTSSTARTPTPSSSASAPTARSPTPPSASSTTFLTTS